MSDRHLCIVSSLAGNVCNALLKTDLAGITLFWGSTDYDSLGGVVLWLPDIISGGFLENPV